MSGALIQQSHRAPDPRKGLLKIISGTAAGQLVVLMSAPLLSRLYTPEQFGILATFSAIAVTLGTMATFRYELAIPLPREDSDARSLALLGLLAAAIIGILGLLAVGFFGGKLAFLLRQPGLMPWLWLVPVSSSATACYLVFSQLKIRQGQFGAIGRRNFWQQLSVVSVQIGSGLGKMGSGGLVVGLAVGHLLSATILLPRTGMFPPNQGLNHSRTLWRSLCRRYWRFPLLLGPAGLLNVLALQMPVLLIAYWYGGAAAGWFGLTQRVLALPVALIATAIGQVYLSELALAARSGTGDAVGLFLQASRRLALVAWAALVVLLILGPWLFEVAFGPAWSTSGHYARAMSLAIAGQVVAAPLSQTLIALERQGLQLVWDAIRVLAVVSAVYLANLAGASALQAVWTVSGTLALTYSASWVMSFQSIRVLQGQNVVAEKKVRLESGPQGPADDGRTER